MNTITNIKHIEFGNNAIEKLELTLDKILGPNELTSENYVLIFMDIFFKSNKDLIGKLKSINCQVEIYVVDSSKEPSTNGIDDYKKIINQSFDRKPSAIIGIGGGVVLDTSKAVSNILNNPGKSSEYQGWDLLLNPGIPKIGIPTVSGTGAESSRTCVLTNMETGLKLGMNSDYTVYDKVIMDPDLSKTVPVEQYFWTGMDAYIHCVEALSGTYRNAIGDAFSHETLNLCRKVFKSKDMKSDENREKMMVASYLGGCSIATSYVGIVHPFSAGLSVVFGTHHCLANCIVMRSMQEFYPDAYEEFWSMVELQGINIPSGICDNLSDEKYEKLYQAILIHEKPLTNALGERFKEILTKEKVVQILKKM